MSQAEPTIALQPLATPLPLGFLAFSAKGVAALVVLISSTRFAVTGVAELTGAPAWLAGAGWVGIGLAAISLYAALALELEGTEHHDVVPTARRGEAKQAIDLHDRADTNELHSEPGAREQL